MAHKTCDPVSSRQIIEKLLGTVKRIFLMKAHGRDSIWLIDTTLRDGEQSPGVAFSRNQGNHCIMLAEAGIDELEVGTPAMGEIEQEDIRAIARLNLPCRLTCWCRARREDIEDAAKCGTGSIHISFPVSSILMNAMNKEETWVLAQLEELLVFARNRFQFVSVGAQDATRADLSFLKTFAEQRFIWGTTGCGSRIPLALQRLFQSRPF